jgi:hypothetical protein
MKSAVRKTRVIFWSLAVTAGFIQAWSYRFYIEPDGVNYLDVATAYSRADWSAAINGYWSPLYSWLLALVQALFHPSSLWESTVLHLLNFAVFLLALRCFEFFFGQLLRLLRAESPDATDDVMTPEWAWWVLGYSAFLLSALRLITLSTDTPDMVLAAWLLLASGLLIQLGRFQNGFLRHAMFGSVLGFAYLTKSVMFPLSFVYIFASSISQTGRKKPDFGGLVALAAFAVVSLPFVTAVSRTKGYVTFGETGKIAYFDEVSAPFMEGKLIHPMHQLFERPNIFEYAAPFTSTFPPWYDPSYWYTGATLRFDLRAQLRAIGRAAVNYFHILSTEKEWIAGWLVLAIFAGNWREHARRLLGWWFLWLPSLTMLLLYALVLIEPRYIGVPLTVIRLILFAALPWPQIMVARRLGTAVFLAIGITTGITIIRAAIPELAACIRPAPHAQWTVAQQLEKRNLAAGDRVAVLGHTRAGDYWAHLAGLRIVADIPTEEVPAYWAASAERRAQVSAALNTVGVRALVSATQPNEMSGWEALGGTGYYVQILSRTSSTETNTR